MQLRTTLILVTLGTLAAPLATWALLPLPYLLGPLITAACVAILLPGRLPAGYRFPELLRRVFIGLIGVMVGGQITPGLFSDPLRLGQSTLLLGGFVLLALLGNMVIFRRLGGYDPATSLCAASPGGLYEAIALGDETGADPARVMLQQFLRVILVVTLVPVGLSLWLGGPVGSAAGFSFAREAADPRALPWIALALGAGMILGPRLRLPAAQLTAPLAAAAVITLSGLGPVTLPQWLVNMAQIVIGTALGLRFVGLNRALLARGAALAMLSVGFMLGLAGGMAAILIRLWPVPFDVALISFAPGGLTEMALIALGLGAAPAFVTLHHIIRILLTVIITGLIARRLDL